MNIADNAERERLDQEIEAIRAKTGKRYAVYTCVLNDYSQVLAPPHQLADVADFFLISDGVQKAEGWNHLLISKPEGDPRRAAKRYKIMPQLILSGYDVSIWIDGNFELLGGIKSLIDSFSASDHLICLFEHRARNCIYAEAEECRRWGKDDPAKLDSQIERYRAQEHPENAGLFMGGFLLRRHNDMHCVHAMKQWWLEVEQGSVRDQIALPVILARLKVSAMKLEFAESPAYFRIHPHRKYNSYVKTDFVNLRSFLAPLLYRFGHFRSRLADLRKPVP